MSIEFTGERVIPGQTDAVLMKRHYMRYQAILSACEGKVVMDIPCGTGYGAHLLKCHGAACVVAVDNDKKTLDYACGNFWLPRIQFTHGDMTAIGAFGTGVWKLEHYDVIVCFEGIEHVHHEDGENLIEVFGHLLKPRGTLFLSTPNKDTSQSKVGKDEFHKHEYGYAELMDLIYPHFTDPILCGQLNEGEPDVIHVDPNLALPDNFFVEAKRRRG